jgi:SOS-response transcriptional repressor LexA
MSPHVTDRQKEILGVIHRCNETRGLSPSIREIGDTLSIRSTNGVNDHLKALQRKGLLTRESLTARSFKLTAAGLLAIGKESAHGLVLNPEQVKQLALTLQTARIAARDDSALQAQIEASLKALGEPTTTKRAA